MKKRNNVDVITFMQAVIKAAAKGHSQASVARELGVTGAAVTLRLQALRRKGIKLPNINSNKGWIDTRMNDSEKLAAAYR